MLGPDDMPFAKVVETSVTTVTTVSGGVWGGGEVGGGSGGGVGGGVGGERRGDFIGRRGFPNCLVLVPTLLHYHCGFANFLAWGPPPPRSRYAPLMIT